MKKIFLSIFLLIPFLLTAQFGAKAGVNFANITHANEVNAESRSGFHAGLFLAGSNKHILSSRTEFLFSRQGYNFNTDMNTGHIDLDYLILPQFMAINITKFVQIQAGFQIAYLLNAKIDSTSSTGNHSADQIINLFNRFDYGVGGGIELHPVHPLVVGLRLNLSFQNLYKVPEEGEEYDFIPDLDAKNNLFQIYAGMVFGKKEE